MKKQKIDWENESWMDLCNRKFAEYPELLPLMGPTDDINIIRLMDAGRIIIKPGWPTKRGGKRDWEAWLIYYNLCLLYGIHMDYADLALEISLAEGRFDYPDGEAISEQTIHNKFAEIIPEFT